MLRGIVAEALPQLRDKLDEADRSLPRFVWRELERYLACRDFSQGFAWLHCDRCDVHRLVPWTCQGRGFCPCCTGRRMAERAAFWVDRVLPEVALRQWVLTVPWRVRWLLARHPHLVNGVVGIAWRAVFRFQQRRAAALGHSGARTGALTAVQRFGSALNLNVHAHSLHLDGVYVEDGDELRFVRLPPPTTEDVEHLVVEIAICCERWLARQGFGAEGEDELGDDEDGMATVRAASVQGRSALGRVRRVQRLGGREFRLPPRCASSMGYNLHAGVAVGARDEAGRERLARYISRGPIAKARLERGPDGEVILRLRRPWSDGTTDLRFTPLALLERLVALIPPPRAHQVLYHGVLAPRSAWRSRVVPQPEEPSPERGPTLFSTRNPRSRWVPWADLLARVFGVRAFECPRCQRRMHLRALVWGPPATTRVVHDLQCAASRPRGPPSSP